MLVHLYGDLAEGVPVGPHRIVANSIREVISFFEVNFPGCGIRSKLLRDGYKVNVFRGDVCEANSVAEEFVHWQLNTEELHIMPELEGRKKGGVFKAVIGAVLIAAAVFFSGGALMAPIAAGTAYAGLGIGLSYASVAMLGVSLIMQSFATPPKTPKPESSKKDQSSLYRGPLNTQDQGSPVPVVYGKKVRVGGVIVHTSLDIEDLPADFKQDGTADDPVIITV